MWRKDALKSPKASSHHEEIEKYRNLNPKDSILVFHRLLANNKHRHYLYVRGFKHEVVDIVEDGCCKVMLIGMDVRVRSEG